MDRVLGYLAIAWMIFMLALFLGCVDQMTGPAFYAGPAAVSVRVPAETPDTLTVRNVWTGEQVTAYPGDSLCLPFHVDGTVTASFIISSHVFPWAPWDWYPSAKFRHVTVSGLGNAILKDNWRASLCG